MGFALGAFGDQDESLFEARGIHRRVVDRDWVERAMRLPQAYAATRSGAVPLSVDVRIQSRTGRNYILRLESDRS